MAITQIYRANNGRFFTKIWDSNKRPLDEVPTAESQIRGTRESLTWKKGDSSTATTSSRKLRYKEDL